jgi:hypothetical protein
MMSGIERNLLQALVDLDETVKTMSTITPKPNLLPLFARLEDLARQLQPNADEDLRHYLKRKSYAKARAWLEGRAAERGSCGH